MATLEELQRVPLRNDGLSVGKSAETIVITEGRIHWRGNAGGCQIGTVTIRVDDAGVLMRIPRIYGSKKLMNHLMQLVKSPDCTLYDLKITQIDDLFIEFNHVDLVEAEKFAATGMMATIHKLALMRLGEPGGITVGPIPKDRRWSSGGKRVIIQ